MEVVVDGAALQTAPEEGEKLGTILDALLVEIAARRRAVVSFRLDGEELSPDRRQELAGEPVSAYARLEVATADPAELAVQTLKGLVEHLSNMEKLHADAAELLRAGEYGSAMEKMVGCFTGWEILIRAVRDVARLCKVDLTVVQAGAETAHGHVERLQEALKEFQTAMAEQDVITVGDVAQHKLMPAAEDWKAVLESISRVVESRTG